MVSEVITVFLDCILAFVDFAIFSVDAKSKADALQDAFEAQGKCAGDVCWCIQSVSKTTICDTSPVTANAVQCTIFTAFLGMVLLTVIKQFTQGQ